MRRLLLDARRDDHELVTAQSRQRVAVPKLRGELPAHAEQQGVARRMAHGDDLGAVVAGGGQHQIGRDHVLVQQLPAGETGGVGPELGQLDGDREPRVGGDRLPLVEVEDVHVRLDDVARDAVVMRRADR